MFSPAFVYLLAEIYAKFSKKIGGKVAHGPREKRLDSSGQPDLDLDPGIF